MFYPLGITLFTEMEFKWNLNRVSTKQYKTILYADSVNKSVTTKKATSFVGGVIDIIIQIFPSKININDIKDVMESDVLNPKYYKQLFTFTWH